jgi:hypothetical protein
MSRPVRRKDRETSLDEARNLLASCAYGVLASVGENGRPYAIPLHYVFAGGCIYFHCATEGQKLDNIRANPAVSFCVVGETTILPGKFATEYESAVVFGTATEIGAGEKQEALLKILEKYSPGFIAEGVKYIAGKNDQTAVVRIDIDHLTGKARR